MNNEMNLRVTIKLLALLLCFKPTNTWTQNVDELADSIKKSPQIKLLPEEKEESLMDYSNIKQVLKKDGLVSHKDKKLNDIKKIKEIKRDLEAKRYQYPNQETMWTFLSELWLVKNAQLLQWDFSKPEYGIAKAFRSLLEQIGYYHKKIKILVVNTPEITHAALPGDKGEYFFLISLPFMRTLDLTKVDISLLFLEDMYRLDNGFFLKNLKTDLSFLGSNFKKSKYQKKYITSLLADYSRILYKDGFSFQQQYKVTKQMDSILKTDQALWGVYLKMLKKIDILVKDNLLYKDYTKIYPSPELQIKWLSPRKKLL
jgi:hypothetical protein